MAKQKRDPIVVTPAGIASWPHLNSPDTKFVEPGKFPKYSVKLQFDPNDPAWAKFMADSQADFDAKLEAYKADNPKFAKRMSVANPAFREVFDEEGEPTGLLELVARMGSQYIDRKTNKVVKLKPGICDAAKNNLTNPPPIWGGSTLKVAVRRGLHTTGAEYTEFWQINGVQIINLVTGGAGSGGVGGMFDAEDGYEDDSPEAPFDDESRDDAGGGVTQDPEGPEDF